MTVAFWKARTTPTTRSAWLSSSLRTGAVRTRNARLHGADGGLAALGRAITAGCRRQREQESEAEGSGDHVSSLGGAHGRAEEGPVVFDETFGVRRELVEGEAELLPDHGQDEEGKGRDARHGERRELGVEVPAQLTALHGGLDPLHQHAQRTRSDPGGEVLPVGACPGPAPPVR